MFVSSLCLYRRSPSLTLRHSLHPSPSRSTLFFLSQRSDELAQEHAEDVPAKLRIRDAMNNMAKRQKKINDEAERTMGAASERARRVHSPSRTPVLWQQRVREMGLQGKSVAHIDQPRVPVGILMCMYSSEECEKAIKGLEWVRPKRGSPGHWEGQVGSNIFTEMCGESKFVSPASWRQANSIPSTQQNPS